MIRPSHSTLFGIQVGAQNAGKSSLINAMRRVQGRPESGSLTTAWVPGTTVGEHSACPSHCSARPSGCLELISSLVKATFKGILTLNMSCPGIMAIPATHNTIEGLEACRQSCCICVAEL